MSVIARKHDASSGIIEFVLSEHQGLTKLSCQQDIFQAMATLIYRLAEMQRLFNSEELAKELEGKRAAEVRAILRERFKHIL